MNDRTQNEHLLGEILAEETPADFRENLLDQTLRLARRRRHLRNVQGAALPLAMIVGVLILVWRSFTPPGISPQSAKPDVLVRSHPLPPGALLVTRPLPPANQVDSSPTANIITTAAAGYRPQVIDDEELLDLAAPYPVVLVRHSPHQAELVYANAGGTD